MAEGAACDVVLTREELHYLGRYVAGEPSLCSPFHDVRPPESLPQPALDDLVTRGLLGPDGVAPALLRALERLHGAEAYGGFALRGDVLESEGVCFFAGRDSVGLVNVAPGLRLVAPAPTGDITSLLDRALGSGNGRPIGLDVTLGLAESRVLAAVVDLLRREALGWMVEGRTEPIDEEALAAWILRPEHGPQWLSGHLSALLGRQGSGRAFEPRSVGPLAGQIAGRGLLVSGVGGFAAGPALAPLVRGMMLLDRVLELRAGRAAPGGTPVRADLVAVRADSGALLLWEVDEQGALRWVTPTPVETKAIATRLLTRQDALGGGR